jgi:hypothetical protein
MKNASMLALAVALSFSGASIAAAADSTSHARTTSPSQMQGSAKTMSRTTVGSAKAGDALNLSSTQRRELWKDIGPQASKETAPSGFSGNVGDTVPGSLRTQPLPQKAASDVPSAKSYNYAMLQDKLLLVNPNDNKVAAVIVQ